MAPSQEMFRFVNTRMPNRASLNGVESHLILDRRPTTASSLVTRLFGPGDLPVKLAIADAFCLTSAFLDESAPAILVLDQLAAFLRDHLLTGVSLIDLAGELRAAFPELAALIEAVPPPDLVATSRVTTGHLWDSLYAQTVRGCYRYVSTNHLIDGLRVYHVLRLWWSAKKRQLTTWNGWDFDGYDALIDVASAMAANGDPQNIGSASAALPASRQRKLVAAPDLAPATAGAGTQSGPVVMAGTSGSAPVSSVPGLPANPTAQPSLSTLIAPRGVFYTPLSVGAIKPPVVGDLLVVDQELQSYVLGELASVESILRGERREHTVRTINRQSQTTTTETSQQQSESTSLTTDERYSLSNEAQKAAAESFGVQAGVNVSGKFGPVQVSASVNASYNTSKSSSDSVAQDYAKTVTQEAQKSVESSIKQTSSVTILTETQDTTLRGFNNEKGSSNINGLYRWVDKIYQASLLNYGRRLMLSITVPEPAAFYRAWIQQSVAAANTGLVEPVPPSRIDRTTVKEIHHKPWTGGFESYQDLDESNYAKLAALYDVAVSAPPAKHLTSSKAFVYPDAMEAGEIKVHDAVNELEYATSDNTISLDPNYRLTQIGVLIPEGASGDYVSWADVLKLGEVHKPSRPKDGTSVAEADLILVQVADQSFYMSVRRDPDDSDKKVIKTNFNTWQKIEHRSDPFGDAVQPSIPVTITAKFEGVMTFTVAYEAELTDEALDAWKTSTYAAIIGGYNAKKQAYDEALTVANANAKSTSDDKTSALRDDQYRSIELTELKRGCIDLLTLGTAAGFTSIKVAGDGTPTIVYDAATGASLGDWRSPMANGSVADFFERLFDWKNTTYEFYPYYWTSSERWSALAATASNDPVFEQFLRAGSASVVVPVLPGYERPVLLFLKTGLIWGGGYLALFPTQDILDAYADVELGRQFDPPLQVGDPWEVRLPTSMIMLQDDDTLPEFPADETLEAQLPVAKAALADESVPF